MQQCTIADEGCSIERLQPSDIGRQVVQKSLETRECESPGRTAEITEHRFQFAHVHTEADIMGRESPICRSARLIHIGARTTDSHSRTQWQSEPLNRNVRERAHSGENEISTADSLIQSVISGIQIDREE